jgi:hypothetical protein
MFSSSKFSQKKAADYISPSGILKDVIAHFGQKLGFPCIVLVLELLRLRFIVTIHQTHLFP